jgi:hypothetical protein
LKKYCPQGMGCDAAEARLRLLKRNPPRPDGNATGNSPSSSGSWVMTASRTVALQAAVDWTETLISVEAGQQMEISASGTVNLGSLGPSGPEGVDQRDARKPKSDCRTGAVIARFADGSVACIGRKASFTVSQPGPILVGLNESNHRDNGDSFNVTIKVFTFR